MKPSRIVAGLMAGIITASLFALPMLGRGFREPMIVKVFYFFVVDAQPESNARERNP